MSVHEASPNAEASSRGRLGQAGGVNDQVCTSDQGGEEAARAASCLG